eukprot:TRINITY_DN3341_c0_g4_i2.p1 TRINITY_DN3341_c0_g4~~TRINITY_DN3341_c0_g4_i2.p1  ORF type:complete len:311 (+),score=59.87 TRINITY_DN3341_c0_g4_i2:128-934(+)
MSQPILRRCTTFEPLTRWSPNIFKLGITGSIASGKSSVLKALSRHVSIDCDKLAHNLYMYRNPMWKPIVDSFGTDILLGNKEINRTVLARKVFPYIHNRELLNSIMWPPLMECIRQYIADYEAEGETLVVVEAAVMIEMNLHDQMDEVWVLGCPPDIAMNRLLKRGAYFVEGHQRVQSQMTLEEKREFADIFIDTHSVSIEDNQIIIRNRLRQIEDLVQEQKSKKTNLQAYPKLPCKVGCQQCFVLEERLKRARERSYPLSSDCSTYR